jgi:hypothetical protein
VDDALLVTSAPLLSGLTSLCLAHCPGVGDAALMALARSAPRLESLDLSGSHPYPPPGPLGHGGLRWLGTGAAAAAAAAGGPGLLGPGGGGGLGGAGGGAWGITDRGLGALHVLRALRHLNIDGARRLTAAGMRALLAPPGGSAAAGPPRLETLSAAGCSGLCDGALAALGEALGGTLRALRLDSCPQITNLGLRRLLPLAELGELSLKGTLVEPRGPAWRALSQRVRRIACDPQAGVHLMGLG